MTCREASEARAEPRSSQNLYMTDGYSLHSESVPTPGVQRTFFNEGHF